MDYSLFYSPKDVAEEQGCVVPEGPVVIERVDGGSQRLQDAVHDAGDQAAHVWAQVQVGVLDQALHHVEKPVELLQVMAYWLHLGTNSHVLVLNVNTNVNNKTEL